MQLPTPAAPASLENLSPSRYNAALVCPARALWSISLPFGAMPSSPSALLGSSFHKVMEAANRKRLIGSVTAVKAEARRLFDEEAAKQLASAHPLVRAKFASPERLPGYYDRREKSVAQASKSALASPPSPSSSAPDVPLAGANVGGGPGALPVDLNARVVEKTLASTDGLLKGRLDCFDPASGTLTDYKSGATPQSGGISESESRQLALYAYLLWENGYSPQTAAIVRADGKEALLTVTQEAAEAEGRSARAVLSKLNATLTQGQRVEEVAVPAPQNCCDCPFVALCPAFWQEAAPGWASTSTSPGTSAAVHVEGEVLSISWGTTPSSNVLTTLELEVRRGTGPRGAAVLDQVPAVWLSCDNSSAPQMGDTVRITTVALPSTEAPSTSDGHPPPASLRVDRFKATAVWTL